MKRGQIWSQIFLTQNHHLSTIIPMKDEVIKASGAIHIPHKLTLIQQQLWNVLLANAFHELKNKQVHEISEQELLDYFPYETRNTEHLKECLDVIVGTKVRYNILEKDKRVWGVFTMLAQAKLEDGLCRWAYAPDLKEKLQDPLIYSKIKLLIQQRFSCKYSLTLYELCLDYVGIHEVPWLELSKFREYMGVELEEYKEYKELNKFVINKAIHEINKKSDLKVSLRVKRTTRKISHLKFKVERNPDFLKNTVGEDTKPINSELLYELLHLKINEKTAMRILKKYPERAIAWSVSYTKKSKDVKNPGGLLQQCLKEKWYLDGRDFYKEFHKLPREKQVILIRDYKLLTGKNPDSNQPDEREVWIKFITEKLI